MNNYLGQNWNGGFALSEFISSMLLSFFVLSIGTISNLFKNKYPKNTWIISSIIWGFCSLPSIYIAMSIGNLIEKDAGLALMSLPFTLVRMFDANIFNALWFVILFQLLGGIIGGLIYLAFANLLKTLNIITSVKEEVSFKTSDYNETVSKSFMIQPIIILSLLFFSTTDFALSEEMNMLIGNILISSVFSFLFLSTIKINYFMLSPWISISFLVNSLLYKEFKKYNLNVFGLEFSIQTTLAVLIGVISYRM